MNKKLYTKFIFVFGLMVVQMQAAEQKLGKAFLGAADHLQRVREIHQHHSNSAEFMPELEPFVQEVVTSFTQKIDQTPTLSQDPVIMNLFANMCQYARDEFTKQTMNLNRLNYLCLQMSILLNQNLNKPYELLKAINIVVNKMDGISGTEGVNGVPGTKLWHLPYDEAYKVLKAYVTHLQEQEAHPKATEMDKQPINKEKVEADSLEVKDVMVNLLSICDRGMNVYPLVAASPFYGIKTFLEAFAEQLTFVGYPLSETCEAHSGLLGMGEYAYVPWHDLLHIFATAPSLDSLENDAHMKSLTQVVKILLIRINNEDISTQKKDLVTLFLAVHELIKYSKKPSVLFNAETPVKEVFTKMLEHAEKRLAKEVAVTLENRETYYRTLYKLPDNLDILTYYEKGGFESIPESPGLKFDPNHFLVVASEKIGDGQMATRTYSNRDFLRTYENARLFSYSIVRLLNLIPGIDQSYGRTFETYSPSHANRIIATLLKDFKEKYSDCMS